MTSMLLTMQQAACIKYADNKKNRFISKIVTGYVACFPRLKKNIQNAIVYQTKR